MKSEENRIILLGVGCRKTKLLEQNLKEAIHNLALDLPIQIIDDVELILDFAIQKTPALLYNDQLLFEGLVPSILEIESKIKCCNNFQ